MNIRNCLWGRSAGAVLAALLCVWGGAGCSMLRGGGGDPVGCEDIDALFLTSGFERPIEINGVHDSVYG